MERNELIEQADQTSYAILTELSVFNEQEFNAIPFEGSWTAGQVAEHLLKSAGVVDVIYGNTSSTNRPPDENEATLRIFLDFTIKMQSPDFIIPSNDFHHKQELIGQLKKAWARLNEAVRTLDLTQTCLDFEMPGGVGKLTRLEWITFYVFHSQRHLHQLKNIYSRLKQRALA